MKIETIAARKMDSPTSNNGRYEAALRLTGDDFSGLAYFTYEYSGRDVMTESLFVEDHIVDVVRSHVPEEGPSVLDGMFGDNETVGDQNELVRIWNACVVPIYEYA
jgi:hypothetical protein